ncbi:MAG: selenocysteine-specific translation elongation factor [Nitrospirae bacterium]|nr:selenocysteine-specific translation elongation factor [Nitrospirota bacterium]
MRHIILGTAGHIDHGKSSLVKALTGIDPDRLKEEKDRGITIDIGFADLAYPEEGLTVGIVDVPGHEKLISNMLAGAGGIDLVLMVIAADEGIMPQSREHLAICDLLKIKAGLIVITKADLVEKEWLGLVADDIKDFVKGTFLEQAAIIAVSSKTGENLDALKKSIRDLALTIHPKTSDGIFRLPIDRVFTLKGFGTVITGTAVSGMIAVDTPVEILPIGITTKVRGLHSHGKAIQKAYAGQRVAINLQGVEKDDLKRGDVAVAPSSFVPTRTLDLFLELLRNVPALKNRSLVHFYAGTSESVARVILYEKEELKAGESCFCQFRLQESVIAMSGDRYIIRRFSPLETIGGGEVLDPSPVRRKRKDGVQDLSLLHAGKLDEKLALKIEKAGPSGISAHAIHGWINADLSAIQNALNGLTRAGLIIKHEEILIHKHAFDLLNTRVLNLLKVFHKEHPLKPGMPKEEIRTLLNSDPRLFNFLLTSLRDVIVDKDLLRLKNFTVALSGAAEAHKAKIIDLLTKGEFQPPTKTEMSEALKMDQKQITDILNILAKERSVVRVNESIYLSTIAYDKMINTLKAFFAKKPELTVAEFRDLLNTSRKFALPFLEHLDAARVTLRLGDARKLLLKN